MKHYILLSVITGAGGVQCYVASKAKYLEEKGWHVVVISGNDPATKETCRIDYLNKYLKNGSPYLGQHACYLPAFTRKKALKRFLKVIGHVSEGDEAIIESWDSPTAIWGELIASRIHGRHIFWTANEHFRKYGEDINMCYEEKIDFYKFKMDRGEIFTTVTIANRLFDGYRTYKDGDFREVFITEDPIQEIDNEVINSLDKKDWNICYLGRSNKPYVPKIFEGIGIFANQHPNKEIQFVVVGEVIANKESLQSLRKIDNLKIVELGDVFPLPRSLYRKIDVVIAGAGSARHSADEGALVITADSWNLNSHGLLGYDTNDSTYKNNDLREEALDLTFEEALERTFVGENWRNQENKWVKNKGIQECTENQFEIIKNANSVLEYYNEKKLLEGRVDYILPLRMLHGKIRRRLNRK